MAIQVKDVSKAKVVSKQSVSAIISKSNGDTSKPLPVETGTENK